VPNTFPIHNQIPVVTADNPTNMMTKPVSLNKFKHCLDLVGVCSF
jgi:hypothetical protein